MASTTAKAFDEFKEVLKLTSAQKDLILARRNNVATYLQQAFPSDSDMPLKKTSLIGSAGRGTIIRPVVDIDVFAQFTNKDSVFETYRNNSQAFLYRIRDALKSHSNVEIVGARGQAVRFFYSQPPHVDVAPVFMWNEGGYGLPDGTGGWMTTDPFAQDAYFAERNETLSNRLKPLVRMLKRWNACHSQYFRSFHLEVVAANVFSSLGGDSRYACEKFFECSQNFLDVNDPAGHSGRLSTYLTQGARANLLTNLETARKRASLANLAEIAGNHEEAIRQWRMVFGDEFPSFG
jgi:hypothetical protein